MRRQHIEEAREAVQGTYSEILQKLNALITRGRCLALYHVDMFLKHNKSLTPIHKQYLISKARAAYHEYVEFLRDGLKFVWQLPIDMRDINAYSYTLTHIRYLPVGQKQFRLLQKSIKMMRREKNVEFLQKSLATEFLTGDIHQLFLKYCVKTTLHGM